MNQLPTTILQFGTGRFLRAFADCLIHHANEAGQQIGSVVIVQSTGQDTVKQLNAHLGKFHVIVRGLENGQVVDRVEEIKSVSCAVSATSQWDDIREIARSPELKFILSNTTEAGYQLDGGDSCLSHPPKSFPAKLTMLLLERFEAGQPPLTIIPCELIEGNADILCREVLSLIDQWNLKHGFKQWVETSCVWLNTLVDRIVTGTPKEHPILATDPLAIVAEPFAFWALQEKPGAHPFAVHPAIVRAPEITPYFLRKVRILNAAHTALLVKAKPRGFPIVREAVNDPQLGAWLERLLFEEIVPTLEGRVDQGELFARQTLERFKNPFLEHKFSDIFLHHESKMKIRLVPTRDEYQAKFAKPAPLLTEVIAEGFEQLAKG
jgi:tagaturonate reductase